MRGFNDRDMDKYPCIGAIAYDAFGRIGLILTDHPEEHEYPNETVNVWKGIHLEAHDEFTRGNLTMEAVEPGDEWTSRKPRVIATSIGSCVFEDGPLPQYDADLWLDDIEANEYDEEACDDDDYDDENDEVIEFTVSQDLVDQYGYMATKVVKALVDRGGYLKPMAEAMLRDPNVYVCVLPKVERLEDVHDALVNYLCRALNVDGDEAEAIMASPDKMVVAVDFED